MSASSEALNTKSRKFSKVTFDERPSNVAIQVEGDLAAVANEEAPLDEEVASGSKTLLPEDTMTNPSDVIESTQSIDQFHQASMQSAESFVTGEQTATQLSGEFHATTIRSKVEFEVPVKTKEDEKKKGKGKGKGKGKEKAGKEKTGKITPKTDAGPKKSSLKHDKSQVKETKSYYSMRYDDEYSGEGDGFLPVDKVESKKSQLMAKKDELLRSTTSVNRSKVSISACTSNTSDFSSSSSSSDQELIKTRRSRRNMRKTDSKRKIKQLMPEEGSDEVLQKIVVPLESIADVDVKKKGKKEKKEKTGKKKKGKKSKIVEVQKTEAQLEEEAKIRAEEERQKFLADKKKAIEKEKRELMEHSMRGEHLDMTVESMHECSDALDEVMRAEQAAEEWRQYLVCDGLPPPWDVPGMNTYIHLWEHEVYTVSAEKCKERTKEAINLLNQLEEIIDDPFDRSERRTADWAWVATRFREFQDLNLEYCTYRLLRDIKGKLNRIDIPTADYRMEEELFSLCLWVSITLPTPAVNPRAQPKMRIQLSWPEMKVTVIFPNSLKREMVAIRGMYTKYDHLTDTSSSYRVGELPPYYKRSLAEFCHEQLVKKMKYKFDHRVIKKKEFVEVPSEEGAAPASSAPEPTSEPEFDENELAPIMPFQRLEVSPSLFVHQGIVQEMSDALNGFAQDDLPEGILNLRKYTVLGGIYYLDLYHQPPQPQGMVSYEVSMSTLTEPYSLQKAPFIVEYEPPPPYEPGTRRTPEEIEEELLQLERKLDELIFLQITLPTHVYWLEPPIVVQWNTEEKAWATNTVFDFKNIEEKGYVTVRTGVFRPLAIATLRWANLPYQAWEIRPEQDETVSFILNCAILTIEFHVVKNTICVRDIQSAPNDAFDAHLNVYYHFSKLRRIMKSIGIDIFPYFDTFLYVEGTCEKSWPTENHLYFCMAYISVLSNMTWSRWNATLDYTDIVFQMRLYRFDRPKQANFEMIFVNAQRTITIDCTEVSAEFNDTATEGMRFCADLWHFIRATTTKSGRTRISNADKTMVKTLYRLYKNVRFLSYS